MTIPAMVKPTMIPRELTPDDAGGMRGKKRNNRELQEEVKEEEGERRI